MTPTGKMTEPRRQTGFSLIEILAAFSILAISLGVLLRIFASSGHIASTADEYYRAILHAESMLASLGVEEPLTPGVRQGAFDENYRWDINIRPYPFVMPVAATVPPQLPPFLPYWVDITVEWGNTEDPHAFTLTTLRLLPGQPPSGSDFP